MENVARVSTPGNEKAEWAKHAAEELDVCRVEWLEYSDQTEARHSPDRSPPQARDLREEMDRNPPMGWGPDH